MPVRGGNMEYDSSECNTVLRRVGREWMIRGSERAMGRW